MAEYSREDFAKMNEQAVKRAQNNKQSGNQPPKIACAPQKEKEPQKKGKDLLGLLNFKNLEIDSDRIIIIALALLLSAEEADELLILALIYIML